MDRAGPGDAVSPMAFRPPVSLRGRYVTLDPLDRADIAGLASACKDPEVWRVLRIGPGRTVEEMTPVVEQLLALQAAGKLLPFTVRLASNGIPIGVFRYLEIDRPNESVELGTWIGRPWWRTPINTEIKLLAFRHAFEGEGAHRVQLKTDIRNVRSAVSIERLGAVREGVLREHIRLKDGTMRSSVYYSVLASEWPTIRDRLERFLARPWAGEIPQTP
ncbi:MAG TPA: GNAT family protein [Thermoplasmata archaeon]|nr:GNAT family protein [Thermoplasmata archaeon]